MYVYKREMNAIPHKTVNKHGFLATIPKPRLRDTTKERRNYRYIKLQ